MNKRKRQETSQLGMNYSTATNRLRKLVLFDLVKQASRDICFRCSKKIQNAGDCTIDHKMPWRGVGNKAFWDLNNISFSHSQCNSSNKRISIKSIVGLIRYNRKQRVVSPKGKVWCNRCQKHLLVSKFSKNITRTNKCQKQCKECKYV